MGKAQTKSSRKRRSVRTKSKGIGTSGYSNANDSNHYYESFPIMASEEHDAEIQKNEAKIGSIKSFEDPGNPLGNAVDFCVDNITALHAKTMELTSSVDMGSVVKPCQEKSLDQLLGDLFLSNKIEARDENEGGEVSANDRDSENPNSKRSWKKTMKGKNIFKRKKSSLPDNSIEDSDNDDLWSGIADDNDAEVDDIITISIGSEQDTLFGNLGNTATWTTIGDPLPEPYEESLTNHVKVVSDEKKFSDEGVRTEKGVETSDKRCEMFFSASTLLALPSCLREPNSDTDADLEKGDMVIPRDFEKQPSMLSLQQDSSTKAIRKREIKNDIDDEEPKIEFEMILDDSRFGKRKWGKVTPWKKLESLFATSNSSRSSGGKRRRRNSRSRSTRSLSSARSASSVITSNNEKSDSTETEVVLNDKIRRKRSFQSKLLGLSSRTRSMPIPRTRTPLWKKRVVSGSPEDKNNLNMEDFLTTDAEDVSTKDEGKSVESTLAGTEGDSLPCSPSDEESTDEMSTHIDTETTEIKDLSSTKVMGLQEWSWGVFNMDQKEEEDHDLADEMSQGDERDGASDYTPQDGDTYSNGNDSNHDGWIMNEDQLMTFSEEDHSSNYSSTHSSVASIDEGDDAMLEATSERPSNSKKSGKPKKREGLRAFPKSIRKTFAPKKKKKALDGFNKDVRVNAESNDDKASDSDNDSAAIEAVLEKKETKGSFFSSLAPSKKASHALEDRDDDYTAGSIQENNDARLATSGGAFFKAKQFLRQQSNRKRSNTISSSNTVDSNRSNMAMGTTVTNPVSASKDIITVVTTSKNENIDAATIDTAPTSVIKSPSSRQHEYVPSPLLDESPVDDDDHDDDRDSAYDESDSAYDESSVSSSSASASTNSRSWARDDDEFQSENILYAGFDFFMSPEVIRE